MSKYYNVEVMLYNEEEYNRIINIINKDYQYASAIHDKDIDRETGELIGRHIHLQIYGKVQKSIKSWSKLLDIKENYIEIIENKVRAIQYLIHKNNPEKYQYEKDIIKSNFDIDTYFKTKDNETNELKTIINYIEQKGGTIKYKEILSYALENNVWSTYRRNYSIIKDYIIEKNNLINDKINDIMKLT